MPGLSDKFDLQFRVETFNVFNHTNFSVTSISSGIAHNDLLQSALSQLAKTEGMKRPNLDGMQYAPQVIDVLEVQERERSLVVKI